MLILKDGKGYTFLHIAARYGDLDMVEKLLDMGADINAKDNDGCTYCNCY
ncbi:ankyrin repeat domain-containing protein [Wolbachia endosymbiont (group B) of Tholera decimalis]